MKKILYFIIRLILAVILLQTLRFKFTTHPDSVYIFNKIGLEPYGRIFIGILELITGILLIIPKTAWFGALSASIILGSAILMHVVKIGIVVNNDGGLLFLTAIISFILSLCILTYYKKKSRIFN